MGLLSNFVLKDLKSKKLGHHGFLGREGKGTEEQQPGALEGKPEIWPPEGQGRRFSRRELPVSDALGG